MTSAKPDLSTRVEDSILAVLREAFPGVRVASYSDSADDQFVSIGVRAESGPENPIGTNIFDVGIEVQCKNLSGIQLQLMSAMIGTAHAAKETIEANAGRSFVMPRGQAVEVLGASRVVEDENSRVVTQSLSASIQPL
jgi:hypothetical protein